MMIRNKVHDRKFRFLTADTRKQTRRRRRKHDNQPVPGTLHEARVQTKMRAIPRKLTLVMSVSSSSSMQSSS